MTQTTPALRPLALITGASGGIGLDLAEEYARHGFDLLLVARSADRLRAESERLAQTHGVRADHLALDLSGAVSARQLVAELERRGLTVTALVNNAGYADYGPFVDSDLDTQLDMIRLNVSTLTALTRLLLPGMLARGRGRVLNVASTASFMPGPLMAVYYATKAYVLSFSEALAEELRGSGVAVTALCPGPTATGFQDRARMHGIPLLQSGLVMDARSVARAGFEASVRGDQVVIPGAANVVTALLTRLTPRRLMPAVVRRLQTRSGA